MRVPLVFPVCLIATLALGVFACSGGGTSSAGSDSSSIPAPASAPIPAPMPHAASLMMLSGNANRKKLPKPIASLISLKDLKRLREGWHLGAQPWLYRGNEIIRVAAQNTNPNPYTGTDSVAFRNAIEDPSDVYLARAIVAYADLSGSQIRNEYIKDVKTWILRWSRESLRGVRRVQDLSETIGAGLYVGLAMNRFTAAYGILHNNGDFSESEIADVNSYFDRMASIMNSAIQLWDGGIPVGGPAPCQRFSNHANSHLETFAAVAIAAQASQHYDFLRARYRLLIEHSIYHPGELSEGCDFGVIASGGEVWDKYRHLGGELNGFGYSMLTIQHMIVVAELFYRLDGRPDLYNYTAPTGENLRSAARFHAQVYAREGINAGPAVMRTPLFLGDDIRPFYLSILSPVGHRLSDNIILGPEIDRTGAGLETPFAAMFVGIYEQ